MPILTTLRRGWRAFSRHQEWNIGVVNSPVSAFLDPDFVPEIHWLQAPPRGKFLADPFVFEHAGIPYVLYEDFDIGSERGHIAAMRLIGGSETEACGPVLSLETHLAYPYVFEWDGGTYCVPESAGEEEIGLYRLERIPGELSKVATLIDGIEAIDPTVFEHDGRWWIACTDRKAGSNESLLLFYADDPMGPWKPHASNPVKQTKASARPAGRPFMHDGQLYRPAQDCTRTYGGRIAINCVTALDPENFAEETVRWIEPDAGSEWHDGIHTINSTGSVTVIDGKRERFIAAAAMAAIRRNLFRSRNKRTNCDETPDSLDATTAKAAV